MNHTDHNAQVEIALYVSKAGSEAEDPDKPSHRATISQLASHHGQCHRCAAIIILISHSHDDDDDDDDHHHHDHPSPAR